MNLNLVKHNEQNDYKGFTLDITFNPEEGFTMGEFFHAVRQNNLCAWKNPERSTIRFPLMNSNKLNMPETGLRFSELRKANVARLSNPKYAKCEENWRISDWIMAKVGELGEMCNMLKKKERGDFDNATEEEKKEFQLNLAKELADVQCYLDIIAFKLGIDLGEATKLKFNEVSDRIGSEIKLG